MSAPGPTRPGIVRGILSGAGARLFVLPVAAIAAIASARLMTDQFGIETFAWYALVAGLPLLLPFADFGMGAAISSAGALAALTREGASDFRRLVRKALLIALAIGGSLALISLLLADLGWWALIVGAADPMLNVPIGAAMATFALSIPGALGYSILLGLGRNGLGVVLQGLSPVISLSAVVLVVVGGGDPAAIIALACVGPFLMNWVGLIVASRLLPAQDAARATPRGMRILPTAAPMMLLMAAGAVYLQSGRLIVAHLGGVLELASLAAAWLFFQPLLSVVQTAARSLWPHFTQARAAAGTTSREFRHALFVMSAIGLVAGAGLVIFGLPLTHLATAGAANPSFLLIVVLGFVLALQGVFAPIGMYLTTSRGLWMQAGASWAAAIVAVLVAVAFVPSIGAVAVPVGLVAGLLGCQLVPLSFVMRRELSSVPWASRA